MRTPARPRAALGWSLFGLFGGRYMSLAVCGAVDAVARRSAAPPDLMTPSGITMLWSRRYEDIPHLSREEWMLDDGTILGPDTPVFETHLSSIAMRRARRHASVEEIDRDETRELAALLYGRPEVALVGRSIFRARLKSMEWSVRETPPSPHRTLDTFLRKLYLMAAKGPRRASRDEGPVAEVAISTARFLARREGL